MEAERLVEIGRRALAESRGAADIMTEAWQAQALARAIGDRLAATGPAELRGDARGLGEIGGRDWSAPDSPVLLTGQARAARLTEVADVSRTLAGLALLLGEAGMALVGVACDTGEDTLYWLCIEAIDAADESMDRVRGMLTRLAEQAQERARERARERDGPYGAVQGRG
ncbi:DUF6099 family protein [Streptomyces sp. NPDC005892]|uniref:DUF6099 family protein n=1 Tax=Streptomyces sp. NPDC005892 TaxID=3155593 RepID=UPI0033CBE195